MMDIECQGCYYTLCAFVCLTEDLSEILQFLWKHGCLRRTYFCEKCGRKCAMGDKDLFFRCNRNTLETSLIPQKVQNLSAQSETHLTVQQTTSQIQFQNSVLLNIKPVLHNSPSSTFVSNSILNHENLNQDNKFQTVNDQKNQINQNKEENNSVSPCINSNLLVIPVLQKNLSESNSITKSDNLTSDEPSVKIQKRSEKLEGKVQKKRCNFKVSMKKGTFFEKSKLPIDTVCKFVVFWCCMKQPTQEFLRNELSLATRTVVDWSTACREICIHWAKSVSEKIGGDGVMVQVDEVKIQDTKETYLSNSRFSFWGMEKDKEKGKIFIVPVPACDSWSLLNVINDWILPGSVIISNCWKAYDCLKSQEFIQQTIEQSKTFVHPQNYAAHHHNFENETGVNSTSEYCMPKFGTRRSHHLGDLAEFMFKRRYSNHLERMHVFFKQISMAYPLH